MKETYLAWLPCEEKGCFGIYDGCIEPQATGAQTRPYLEDLRQKVLAHPVPPEIWKIDAGTWYFGAHAVSLIEHHLKKAVVDTVHQGTLY